ncbi:MAG: hypothetical protein RIA64_07630 [Rhodospirillales bacterium]
MEPRHSGVVDMGKSGSLLISRGAGQGKDKGKNGTAAKWTVKYCLYAEVAQG